VKTLLLLLLLLLPGTLSAAPVKLVYTLPTTNVGLGFDPDTGDSTIDCSLVGGPLTDLKYSYLYGVSADGGNPLGLLILTHNVSGKAGLPDTFEVGDTFGWHYWVQTADSSGNKSCASNVVYVGPITGVTPGENPDAVVETMIFDVRGRRVTPLASGIYFKRTKFKSGKEITRKFVFLK